MKRKLGLLFPGQGSQAVGMGLDVRDAYRGARAVFAQADGLLGFSLSRLCFEGPESELRQTAWAQPALFVTSLACWAALKEAVGRPLAPAVLAGHSLGEYAALVVGGAIDFATGLSLVRERGRLMQEAAEGRAGGMAAVLGLGAQQVEEVCSLASEHGVVGIANLNGPGQVVISGELDALTKAGELAKAKGARRVVPLAVNGAFHSPLMETAAQGMGGLLAQARFRTPPAPTLCNVTGQPYAAAEQIAGHLAQQVVAPVQWSRCVEAMGAMGVHHFAEVGPGGVLAGLVKRVLPEAEVRPAGTAAEVEQVAEWLNSPARR